VRVIDTVSGCAQPNSNAVTVVVNPDATVSITANNPEVCVGGSALLTANVTGGSTQRTLQWQSGTSASGPWTDIGGQTSSTYAPPTGSTGTFYYRIQVNDPLSDCAQPASNVITFTVNPDASISVDEDLVVCIDGIATLTSTLTGSSSSATVQWQSSASASGPWSDISGATSSLYSAPTTAIGVTYYRARVIDVVSGCDQAISNSVSVTVEEDAEITASANNSEVCIDGSVILTAATTGGSGELTIQWQDGPGVTGPWTDIAGETNTTYSPSTSVAGTYYYRVFVIDPLSGCGQPATDPITIVVNPDVTLDVSANNSNVCVGGNVTITATVGGGSSSRTLQWQSGTSTTGPWTAIPGATTGAYTAPTTTAGTYYYRL
jgi:hypothetical protein